MQSTKDNGCMNLKTNYQHTETNEQSLQAFNKNSFHKGQLLSWIKNMEQDIKPTRGKPNKTNPTTTTSTTTTTTTTKTTAKTTTTVTTLKTTTDATTILFEIQEVIRNANIVTTT